jgi:GH24 family phage-related lysozyme (muramidase)
LDNDNSLDLNKLYSLLPEGSEGAPKKDSPKDPTFDYYKKLNSEGEGYAPAPVEDSKGHPTVGFGVNLDDPEMAGLAAARLGVSPDMIRSGQRVISPNEAQDLQKAVYENKKAKLDKLRNNRFPAAELGPQQTAALTDMYQQHSGLIGPNLMYHLNNNDDSSAIKEILLNSNKAQSPGQMKRRLMQASMFGGDAFNDTVKNMSPDEKDQIRSVLNKMQNSNELQNIYKKYPVLSPEMDYKPAPASFPKIKKLFGD